MSDREADNGGDARLNAWAQDQRKLARTLGLSISQWLEALDDAGERRTGLTAAVVGAAVARGLGLSVLDQLDGPALARSARNLIDPAPPRVKDAVLAEAIRRADEMTDTQGRGAQRLRAKRRDPIPTPQRETRPIGDSAPEATADAPGGDE